MVHTEETQQSMTPCEHAVEMLWIQADMAKTCKALVSAAGDVCIHTAHVTAFGERPSVTLDFHVHVASDHCDA